MLNASRTLITLTQWVPDMKIKFAFAALIAGLMLAACAPKEQPAAPAPAAEAAASSVSSAAEAAASSVSEAASSAASEAAAPAAK